MRYVSTRAAAAPRDFAATLLAGLAEDGGLFVPDRVPFFSEADWRAMRGLPYPELAARLMAPFVAGCIGPAALSALFRDAMALFRHPALVPLIQIGPGLHVAELFHGPSFAFKDFALQTLGRLFDHVLAPTGRRVTIVAATSGDTGSAAIAACRDRAAIDLVVLHPAGRVSEVQRRQMTTVRAANVTNLAIEGSFDTCQDLVKALFADAPFREAMRLSAVNSINWARIIAQVPYYAATALALGAPDRAIAFSVPTGNFGNVLAAHLAARMGLPVARLMVASNRNDILTRFFTANDMRVRGVTPSLSPSMDIEISSNFERLLFDLLGRDGTATASLMGQFRRTGHLAVPDQAWREAGRMFAALSVDDEATLAEMALLWREAGYLADPHGAIAVAGARALRATLDPAIPVVAMATAHPAKFPDAVRRALGFAPPVPAPLADLAGRPEIYETLPADRGLIQARIRRAVEERLA